MSYSRSLSSLILAAMIIAPWTPLSAMHRGGQLSPKLLATRVGRVDNKCCLPGRRWGCNPTNLRQSGCTSIRIMLGNCSAGPIQTMMCTGATCQSASSEDHCEHNFVTVGHNRCKPMGIPTTIGCPADEWQCLVAMTPYWSNSAPTSDVYVCDNSESTICSHTYSECE